MAAGTGDKTAGKTISVINVERKEVLKKLKGLKAKTHSKYVSRNIIFEVDTPEGSALNEGERRHNTWMRISDDDGRVSMMLRHMPSPRGPPAEHVIGVNDFITAVRIARAVLHAINYSYLEISKETYDIDGRIVTIIQWPYMQCELEITGRTVTDAMKLYKELGIKGEISHRLDVPHSVYYRLRGLDFDMVRKHYNKRLERLLQE